MDSTACLVLNPAEAPGSEIGVASQQKGKVVCFTRRQAIASWPAEWSGAWLSELDKAGPHDRYCRVVGRVAP